MAIREALAVRLRGLFGDRKSRLIGELAAQLGYSVISVRRFLVDVGYYSSYTHNARWYTLADIPVFGRDGLWFDGDIGFSRSGSLTETLVDLVGRSSDGLTAEELGDRLRCRCHTVLPVLVRAGRLDREKVGRHHVYFSVAARVNRSQRAVSVRRSPPAAALPAEIAVLAFASFIASPDSTAEQLSQRLRRERAVSVTAEQIECLFEEHGVKKTLRAAPRTPCGR